MSTLLESHSFPNPCLLEITRGDLTQEPLDAIVNAANAHLRHGGGVAAAIVRAGGRVIQEESDQWIKKNGPVQHDHPAYTGSGKLPCRYVIHAVGPVWGEGNEDQKLADAISGSLKLAETLNLHSIAFPAISTGIFGFPKERAAGLFFKAIAGYLKDNPSTILQLIRITLFDQPTLNAFIDAFHAWQSGL